MLMTEHNLFFYQALMAGLRKAVAEQRLDAFARHFNTRYKVRERSGAA
jgi:queuine tRNA-ribosyltransferase